jgi:hypothetical protein
VRALVAAALLLAAYPLTGASLAAAEREAGVLPESTPPPHVARGDQVEARYRGYRERLEALYRALASRLTGDAPGLLPKLAGGPPAPVVHGYQILPRLGADAPPPSARPRATSARYSWPWTDRLIEREVGKIDALEADLVRIPALTGDTRRAAYEKMVGEYRRLPENQQTIDAHIQHNRLWQSAIAGDRAGYDRQTVLHDVVLERQAVLDALSVDAAVPGDALRADLAGRAETLARLIGQAIHHLAPVPFRRAEHLAPRRWVVQVPLYTDIEDAAFVGAFKLAVETAWRVHDGADEFGLALTVVSVSPAQLYPRSACGSGGGVRCGPPAKGEGIEVSGHVARFPGGGGILTTGAASTHVWGRAIILGPHDIAPRVLAHEFGHLLGFPDMYFRGYRDLGADGFEVMEVVAEPDDIMGNPGVGFVHRRHFELLIGRETLGATLLPDPGRP